VRWRLLIYVRLIEGGGNGGGGDYRKIFKAKRTMVGAVLMMMAEISRRTSRIRANAGWRGARSWEPGIPHPVR